MKENESLRNLIEELTERIDIFEVISTYLPPSFNHRSLCPRHDDYSPFFHRHKIPRSELKEIIIINIASDSNFLPAELEFYTWLIWALGLQNCRGNCYEL